MKLIEAPVLSEALADVAGPPTAKVKMIVNLYSIYGREFSDEAFDRYFFTESEVLADTAMMYMTPKTIGCYVSILTSLGIPVFFTDESISILYHGG
jgi:hypothetical protein